MLGAGASAHLLATSLTTQAGCPWRLAACQAGRSADNGPAVEKLDGSCSPFESGHRLAFDARRGALPQRHGQRLVEGLHRVEDQLAAHLVRQILEVALVLLG